mmetsp:Transcript_15108/g.32100  ORF Transcript_15108/g.32100 Transcript_15108/m.32100 type:complete len:200 (+) Transcript_15108:1148-1747(+)
MHTTSCTWQTNGKSCGDTSRCRLTRRECSSKPRRVVGLIGTWRLGELFAANVTRLHGRFIVISTRVCGWAAPRLLSSFSQRWWRSRLALTTSTLSVTCSLMRQSVSRLTTKLVSSSRFRKRRAPLQPSPPPIRASRPFGTWLQTHRHWSSTSTAAQRSTSQNLKAICCKEQSRDSRSVWRQMHQSAPRVVPCHLPRFVG